MKSPLELTVAAASAANMTYGAFVLKHGAASQEQAESEKYRLCAECGGDISHKHQAAKYCNKCAHKRQEQQAAVSKANYRKSYKTDRQKRGTK